MTANLISGSATIHQFPKRADNAVSSPRAQSAAVYTLAPRLPVVEFGSGWYHAEAIRDAERARRH